MSWKTIDVPKTKVEWRDKYLRLMEAPPSCRYDGLAHKSHDPLPVTIGDIAQIYMRRNLDEVPWWTPPDLKEYFGKRVIELVWKCPHCANPHHLIIPESWIAEGKAIFVEADDAGIIIDAPCGADCNPRDLDWRHEQWREAAHKAIES